MKKLNDPVWRSKGISWIWDEEARNLVCAANEIWSIRQFIQATGHWPEDLPGNKGDTLVVAGLDGSLDLLCPEDAEAWLGDTIKEAMLSFQGHYEGETALIFWLPQGDKRLEISATDAVNWKCGAPYSESRIDFGRILWGEAREYPKELYSGEGRSSARSIGLFHRRIS
ncbi:MAG: hypothetical protein LBQ90_00200 [Synergistaceae bacterium]|nr:hypothetical protein [Synergistaceae bacterium]